MQTIISAVLLGAQRSLAGIITDRDLALPVFAGGLDPKRTPLGDVMSEEVVTCDIGADLNQVVRLAATRRSANPAGRWDALGRSRDVR